MQLFIKEVTQEKLTRTISSFTHQQLKYNIEYAQELKVKQIFNIKQNHYW